MTLTLACPVTWGDSRTRCRYWQPRPGVHGCNLDPGHDGKHRCGCAATFEVTE